MPDVMHNQKLMPEESRELVKTALGEAEADLAVVNGDVVNVYTGELMPEQTVLVKGNRIAYVGRNAIKSIGRSTRIIDASGEIVIPGLVDGHTHIDNHYLPGEFSRYAVAGGVTTIFTEVDELAFALGTPGIELFLKWIHDLPIKCYVTIPPMVTFSPLSESNAITVGELRSLLERPDVVGLGEAYWTPLIREHGRVNELIAETISSGKFADGHSAGARDNKLQAYISLGISSCHEPITAEEAKERLRLGLYVPIREGEIREDLAAISEIRNENIDLSRLILSTDGISPSQLVDEGYLEVVVRKAIKLGFDPITAIKMATINPARRFGLDNFIGGISPGKSADLVIIPDIEMLQPETVISSGRLIFENGKVLTGPVKHEIPAWTGEGVKIGRELKPEDFDIDVDPFRDSVTIRVIDLITSLVTKEALLTVPVPDGKVKIDTVNDLIKIAAIERRFGTGKIFTGLLRGFKLKSGAVAVSAVWDCNVVIAAGANELDMALAVNRLRELRGGMVVCERNRVVAELALPVGGVAADEKMELLAGKLSAIQTALNRLGFPYPNMRTTLTVMATPAIPYLRICEEGLFDLYKNSFVELIVD